MHVFKGRFSLCQWRSPAAPPTTLFNMAPAGCANARVQSGVHVHQLRTVHSSNAS